MRRKKPQGRSCVTNGKHPHGFNGRSAKGRRFNDLMSEHLANIPDPDAGAIALARTVSLTTIKIEQMQAAIVNSEDIDDLKFVRLTGALSRSLTALRLLKEKAQPAPSASDPSQACSALQAHIREIIAARKPKPEPPHD
jgi:hypothetical protein